MSRLREFVKVFPGSLAVYWWFQWLRARYKRLGRPQRPGFQPVSEGRRQRIKRRFTEEASRRLRDFLASDERLSFSRQSAPRISIVLILYHRAELTFLCLESLQRLQEEIPFEVILVDNASADATGELLARLDGVTIERNPSNLGFVTACNQGARRARGVHLLFLNNDCTVTPGSLKTAVTTLESDDRIGAVGARILLLDGALQEAGCIVWQDGSCSGYGRDDDPLAAEYMFRRDVDYASGAFLLTPKHLFDALGGLDECFSPAYYEETDYCLRLQEHGYRIVYEPQASICHFEFASSSSLQKAMALMAAHRQILVQRHQEALAQRQPNRPENLLCARSRDQSLARILILDDRLPRAMVGGGFPRANGLLQALQEIGCFVTLYPLLPADESWSQVYRTCRPETEVMLHWQQSRLRSFLKERHDYYDAIVVYQPNNLELLFAECREFLGHTKIVYHAEATSATREELGRKVDYLLTVSPQDAEQLRQTLRDMIENTVPSRAMR